MYILAYIFLNIKEYMKDEYLDHIKSLHITRVAILNDQDWLEDFSNVEDAIGYVSAITERSSMTSMAADRISARVGFSDGAYEQCVHGSGAIVIQWLRRFL